MLIEIICPEGHVVKDKGALMAHIKFEFNKNHIRMFCPECNTWFCVKMDREVNIKFPEKLRVESDDVTNRGCFY